MASASGIFILILLIVLIGGGIIFAVYKFKEEPIQEQAEIKFHTLNVKFLNNLTGKETATPYSVEIEGQSPEGRNYLGVDYDQFQSETNKTVRILNSRQEECFYTSAWEYPRSDSPTSVRVEIPIIPCGKLSVGNNGSLLFEEQPTLFINASGEVRNLAFCLTWSKNILTVTTRDPMAKFNTPRRLQGKVVKCYDARISLTNNQTAIPLNYRPNNALDTTDFIRVTILDGDREIGITEQNPWEGGEHEDVAVEDLTFTIK